jgi:hypothetical protein
MVVLFALLYGWVAFSFSQPGVLTASPYCPPPVLVGVDFYPHYIAGQALWHGLSPYDKLRHRGGPFVDPVPDHPGLTSRFTYPPPAAYLFAPLSRLPAAVAWKIWLAVSVAGMTLALASLVRLAGRDRWFGPLLAGVFLPFYPLHFATINGNVVLVCLILTVWGLHSLLAEGPAWVTALLLALATAIKLYPGIFLLYFLAQRRWGLAWRMTAALALLVVLTARGGLWLAWLERAREFDRFHQAWYLNGSLYSLLAMSGTTRTAAFDAAKLLAVAALALALWWTRRRSADSLVALYQGGLLCVAILLAPNTVYDYNLIFVLPALAAGLWDLRRNGFSPPLALLAVAYAGMAVPSRLAGQTLVASKFPWLLVFFVAIVWRLRPGRTPQTAAAAPAG